MADALIDILPMLTKAALPGYQSSGFNLGRPISEAPSAPMGKKYGMLLLMVLQKC